MLDRGIDVRECFGPAHLRDRDWRTIWSFKDRLPRHSNYKAALADDEELAEQLIAAETPNEDDSEPAAPSPVGYTLTDYLLLSVIDALMGVQAAVIAAAGADPPRVTPMPRPETAVDRVRERLRLNNMQELIDMFSPQPLEPE